jgi:putative peptidoglycan lipid II flippase
MSVAAAELPQMSVTGDVRSRLERGLRQIAFFVVPSVAAFLFIGRALVAALYQTGEFRADDTLLVWYILAGSTVGLLAVTLGRLYSSAFYALRDPKTPLRFAVVRVCLTAVLGVVFAFPLRPAIVALIELLRLRVPQTAEGVKVIGAVGLTASAGMAGWIEFALLRRALARRIGTVSVAPSFLIRLWISALIAAAAGVACDMLLPRMHHILHAVFVAGAFGVVYFAATMMLRVEEARATLGRLRGGR